MTDLGNKVVWFMKRSLRSVQKERAAITDLGTKVKAGRDFRYGQRTWKVGNIVDRYCSRRQYVLSARSHALARDAESDLSQRAERS
jgi:hypothetical protein